MRSYEATPNAKAFLDGIRESMVASSSRLLAAAARVDVAAPGVSRRVQDPALSESVTRVLAGLPNIVVQGPVAQLEAAIELSHQGFRVIQILADECDALRSKARTPIEKQILEGSDAKLRDSLSRVAEVPRRSTQLAIELERLATMAESSAVAGSVVVAQANVVFNLTERFLDWQPAL